VVKTAKDLQDGCANDRALWQAVNAKMRENMIEQLHFGEVKSVEQQMVP